MFGMLFIATSNTKQKDLNDYNNFKNQSWT